MLSAQSGLMQKADTAYARQEYLDAMNYYLKVLKNEPKQKHAIFRIAECFRAMNKYGEAAEWYEKAMDAGYQGKDLWKNYADMLVLQGNYQGAMTAYQQYSELHPDDKHVRLKIDACKYSLENRDKVFSYKITNESAINSTYSDYGAARLDNKIIFASTRVEETENSRFDQNTGQGFSDFYEATFNSKDSIYEQVRKSKGAINTKFNDGTFSYHSPSQTGYYMQCNGESGKKEDCRIYFSKYNSKTNSWSASEVFDYMNGAYVGHPSITDDGNTLYFVSTMPGGFGGKDIWFVKKENSTWSKPVNAGPSVNTIADEMFPCVSGDTMLYFSSDGLKGFGGLDLFGIRMINGKFSGTPENLNLPINSSADDFSIFFTSFNSGTFCSNRPGGKGDDDIYSFRLSPLKLSAKGNIVENLKLKPMSGVKVTMKGSDGTEHVSTTDSKGGYEFNDLKPNVTYTVSVQKKGYFGDAKTLATGNVKYAKEYSKKTGYDLDFGMLKLTKEEVEIPNIYYEFNKAELNEYSRKSLDQLSVMLKETPDVKVVLNAHTDEKGSDDYNLKLSERRAMAVVNYLISTGISSERLDAKGYGESLPLVKNAQTEEEHSKNRRTTFKVTQK